MKSLSSLSILAACVAVAAGIVTAFEDPRFDLSFGVTPAAAKDVLGSDRWNFRHRGSAAAMNKATTMWQVERTGDAESAGGTAAYGSGGGSGGSAGGGTAIANYNDIDVYFAEDSEGSVVVNTDQDSTGDQTTKSTDMINIIDTVETGGP